MKMAEIWLLVLGTVITSIGGWAAKVSANRAWLRDFLARVKDERETVVLETEQVIVDRIKKARAETSPGGVELTPEEQLEAKDAGVTRLLELVGLAALDRALRLMGLPRLPDFIRRWATSHVEAAVKRLSIEQAAAARPAELVRTELADTRPMRPVK